MPRRRAATKSPAKPLSRAAQLPADIEAEAVLLMQRLSASDPNWDALLAGDGSGTNWNEPIGWATVLFDRHFGRSKRFKGAMDCGTSYLAELMPYVQALSWYLEGHGRHLLHERRKEDPNAYLRIHILTDNKTVALQGRGEQKRTVGSYYWAMFDSITDRDAGIAWHYAPRLSTGMNKLCDLLAGEMRIAMRTVLEQTSQ